MMLWDVNVLVNARVAEQKHHDAAADVIRDAVASALPFALSELSLSGYVRIVTSPRALRSPDSVEEALSFCDDLRAQPNARVLAPGPALAIEHNCEWISFDRDFARFPGLRWRHPLD